MAKHSKKYNEALKKKDVDKLYSVEEAISLLKEMHYVKFDETLEAHLKLEYKSLQNVRGVFQLPHGTGKKIKILVFAKDDYVDLAKKAGADYVGDQEYIEKIQDGWLDFDVVIATPDMMKNLSKLGPILGRKGLMPKPKAGTVTTEVEAIIKQLKAGRLEYKSDKTGVIHTIVGKISFSNENIKDNIKTMYSSVMRDKPSDVKGDYITSIAFSGTQTPSVKINLKDIKSL